jgi:mRNA-degrading endonuclease toxin of MazEF toxin-antitoxin module
LKRRLGFAARGSTEAFVVVQDDALNRLLPTALAVPLDVAIQLHEDNPLAVPVSAAEAGARIPHVALATHVTTIPWDRFEPAAAGRFEAATMAALDGVLRVVLALP